MVTDGEVKEVAPQLSGEDGTKDTAYCLQRQQAEDQDEEYRGNGR